MKYDVTKEPCIAVTMLDGSTTNLTFTDVLKNAHEIKCLGPDDLSPYDQYALYRFLSLFVQDIFRPCGYRDTLNLFKIGLFDSFTIDEYFDGCRKIGVTFDLFDEKRPFMQTPKSFFNKDASDTIGSISIGDTNIHGIRKLNPEYRYGTNDVFYNGNVYLNYGMSAHQYFACILRNLMFHIFVGGGWKSSIKGSNGAAPIGFVMSGQNLFETLILSLSGMNSKDYEKAVPIWKKDVPYVDPKEIEDKYGSLSDDGCSWLDIAIVPQMFLYGEPEDDGFVHKVSIRQLKIVETLSPTLSQIIIKSDTCIIKGDNKKGDETKSHMPNKDEPDYKSLAAINAEKYFDGSLKIIRAIKNSHSNENDTVNISFYMFATPYQGKGFYISEKIDFPNVPISFYEDENIKKAHFVIDEIDRASKELIKKLKNYIAESTTGHEYDDDKKKNKKNKDFALIRNINANFYKRARHIFISDFVPNIEIDGIEDETIRKIRSEALAFYKKVPRVCNDFIEYYKNMSLLEKSLNK